MIKPPLDALLKTVDCKYTLVVLAAKRARAITNGEGALIESKSNKPVTVALEEIASGRITYHRTKNGIK